VIHDVITPNRIKKGVPMPAMSVSHTNMPRVGLLRLIATALELRRQRRHLAQLDALQLRDIGLTADAAMAESRRPVWDAPPHWRL
jgi:uncharacterized protein YjiS (DUF1127 family)